MEDYGVRNVFRVTAISQDYYGEDFVAAFEGSNLPFFGVVYHPEKPMFAYVPRYEGKLV